ncbi:MAG: hypothetical protein JNG83_07640 [Opitutaceae bacterium]|nr:hypothetical protein [Opitutaceae bacterium]
MKFSLTLTLLVTPHPSALLDLAVVLRRFAPAPESLLWSTIPGSGEARAWLLVELSAETAELLCVHLGRIAAVRRVRLSRSVPPSAPAAARG